MGVLELAYASAKASQIVMFASWKVFLQKTVRLITDSPFTSNISLQKHVVFSAVLLPWTRRSFFSSSNFTSNVTIPYRNFFFFRGLSTWASSFDKQLLLTGFQSSSDYPHIFFRLSTQTYTSSLTSTSFSHETKSLPRRDPDLQALTIFS